MRLAVHQVPRLCKRGVLPVAMVEDGERFWIAANRPTIEVAKLRETLAPIEKRALEGWLAGEYDTPEAAISAASASMSSLTASVAVSVPGLWERCSGGSLSTQRLWCSLVSDNGFETDSAPGLLAVRYLLTRIVGQGTSRRNSWALCRLLETLSADPVSLREAVGERGWPGKTAPYRLLGLSGDEIDPHFRTVVRSKEQLFADGLLAAFVPQVLWAVLWQLILDGPETAFLAVESALREFADGSGGDRSTRSLSGRDDRQLALRLPLGRPGAE